MATGDGLYHTYGSWLDDPTIPYASLTGHIAALMRARTSSVHPTTSPSSASGLRASTPRSSTTTRAQGFEELLALSRTVFPYVEEHKFICDYWFLTSWWNKIREFGDLLVAHGFLPDRDAIFQLSRLEVYAALDELAPDVGDRRAAARAEVLAADRRRGAASCSRGSATGRRRPRSARSRR